MSARGSLGVDWHLPARKGGYARRPFATSTRADSDQIVLLAADGLTWNEVKTALHFPSQEQTIVIDRFIAEGHGEAHASEFFAAEHASVQTRFPIECACGQDPDQPERVICAACGDDWPGCECPAPLDMDATWRCAELGVSLPTEAVAA